MSDEQLLAGYIEVGRQAIDDFVALLESLPDDAWLLPSDLPGWTVKDIASHVAHIESQLASTPAAAGAQAEGSLATPPVGYTESGVLERREHSPEEIIAEIRRASALRWAALEARPPTDAQERPPLGVPGLSWSWSTLLRNRPLDVWMHEQDIRRAVGRPGGLESPPAAHTARYFAEGLGYVIAKRAKADPGSSVVFEIGGEGVAFEVGSDGRGVPLREVPEHPTVRIRMDLESYIVLSGGRREPADGAVTLEGDEDLGRRILANLTMTA